MSEEEKKYETPVLFLRKSKKGQHIYAFNRDGILGEGVGSLVMNVSDVKKVIDGSYAWTPISVMPPKENADETKE